MSDRLAQVICMACSTTVGPREGAMRCQCGSVVQPPLFELEDARRSHPSRRP